MAAPSKKRAVQQEMVNVDEVLDSDDGDSGDDYHEEEMEGQEFVNQEIQVEFEARNIEDSDFHGVRKLLSQLYLKSNVDLSELTDTLISQNYIGSVIKQVDVEEDEDTGMNVDEDDDADQVFGVISVLNITERKNLKCVKDIKSMLLERCEKCSRKNELASILNDSSNSVGYIINERFINIPPQISVPSFESLWKEMERAKSKKMPYNFTHYMMLAKVCSMTVKGLTGQTDIRTFINGEEEIFSDASVLTCEYSVKGEHDGVVGGSWDEDDDEMEPLRVVMVISADKISDIMTNLKESYG